MNDKYYDDPYRLDEGDCYNFGVDDRFVANYSVTKRPSEGWGIIITAKIKELGDLYQDITLPKEENSIKIVV